MLVLFIMDYTYFFPDLLFKVSRFFFEFPLLHCIAACTACLQWARWAHRTKPYIIMYAWLARVTGRAQAWTRTSFPPIGIRGLRAIPIICCVRFLIYDVGEARYNSVRDKVYRHWMITKIKYECNFLQFSLVEIQIRVLDFSYNEEMYIE